MPGSSVHVGAAQASATAACSATSAVKVQPAGQSAVPSVLSSRSQVALAVPAAPEQVDPTPATVDPCSPAVDTPAM